MAGPEEMLTSINAAPRQVRASADLREEPHLWFGIVSGFGSYKPGAVLSDLWQVAFTSAVLRDSDWC